MEKSKPVAIFLASTTFLWIWQGSMPVFDNALPFLNISDSGFHFRGALKANEQVQNDSIIVSVSEIIALYVGVAIIASLYSLFTACSEGQANYLQNLAFSVLAALTSSGYGMHAVCVIAQLQITQDNPLYSLLDFVHERWSHNMFQFGNFSLLLLIILVERPSPSLISDGQTPTSSVVSGKLGHQRGPSPASRYTKEQSTVKSNPQLPLLTKLWLRWLGPVILGLFTAIFSLRTETGGIAFAFYMSVIVLFINYHYNLNVLSQGNNEYVAMSFFVTSALIGIPTLFIIG